MPLLVSLTSMHCLAHPEGECATAQGAGAAGTLMIASTDATRPLEEIAQTATGPLWFQLYIYHSLEVAASMVRRAEAPGHPGLLFRRALPLPRHPPPPQPPALPPPPPPPTPPHFFPGQPPRH